MSTFSQIYIQIVFAVKGRQSLIKPEWEESLYKYVTGIVTNKGQKMLAVNGIGDHIHVFINIKPSCILSDLVREIKKSTHTFINDQGFTTFNFSWQEGYGAFSYSYSDLDKVIKYIANQKEHHKRRTFKQEYLEFLNTHEIQYEEAYLFDWIDPE
ncbi:MAG TPA: IS200/IS605 family transposase [Bacteroidia bacterium]|jgi:putative transposase|nr:IS200/IS605 family transposase [Bacteroidia bacterium]